MLKIKIFIPIAFLYQISYSQGNASLYFVSGCPEMQYDELTYLTVLYKQRGNILTAIDTLTTGPKMVLKSVKFYSDYDFAFFQDQNYLDNSDNQVVFMDLASRLIKKGIVPFQRVYSFPVTLYKDENLQIVLGKERSDEELTYQGLNKLFSVSNIEATDFKTLLASGYRGAPLKNPDVFRVAIDLGSGDVKIPKTKRVEDRPSLGVTIPKEYLSKADKFANIIVKNEQFIVFELYQNEKHKEFIIFDTQKETWRSLNIGGNRSRIQSYGEWISASKASSNENTQAISPGVKYRKKSPDSYGPGFDVMTKVLELYYPGELFLYHVPTQKEISWKTYENREVQGDSEVLLVENNEVYYRINDIIYKASIIGNEKLGKPELLLKDTRVADIHWAFLSSNKQ